MEFDTNNRIVQLCSQGMEREANGEANEAGNLFKKAWERATNDFEKYIAAHYVARHQQSISDKLKWDKTALHHALKLEDSNSEEVLPSLYLNIGKGYEELNDFDNAKKNYETAFSFADFLSDDRYGKMIKAGIINGLKRVT